MEVQRWLTSSFRQCVWSNIKTSWLKGCWCSLPGQKRLICLGCRFVPETGIHRQEIIWLLMAVPWPFEDRACCIQWIVYHIIIWGVWRMGWQQSHSCSLSGFWCMQKHYDSEGNSNLSFVLSSSPHHRPVMADGCPSLKLVLLEVSSCCCHVLDHRESSDCWGFLFIIERSLPCNIKHLDLTVVVIWRYVSNAELNWNKNTATGECITTAWLFIC